MSDPTDRDATPANDNDEPTGGEADTIPMIRASRAPDPGVEVVVADGRHGPRRG